MAHPRGLILPLSASDVLRRIEIGGETKWIVLMG